MAQAANTQPGLSARIRRVPWLDIGGALVAVGAGAGLGLQLTGRNWTDWITYVGMAFHVAVALVNPLVGLLLYTITSPFARWTYLDLDLGSGIPDLSLARMVAGTLAVVFLANVTRGRWRFRGFNLFDISFLAFFAGMVLSAPASPTGGLNAAQNVFDAYFVPFVLYLVARHLVSDDGALWLAIGALLFIGGYLSFLTVREQLTGQILFNVGYAFPRYSENIRKVVGLLGSPTFMGMALAVIVPVAFYAFLRARSLPSKVLTATAFAAVLLGLFMTYSRGAWLGAAIALVVMGVLYRPARRFLVPMLVAAAVLAAVFWSSIVNSVAVTERLTAEASVDFRITALDIAFKVIVSHPIFGVGFNGFGDVAARVYGWSPFVVPGLGATTHNTFLFVLTSAGLVGFLPYLVMSLYIPYLFWRGYRRARQDEAYEAGLPVVGLAAYLAYLAPSLTVDMPFGFFVNTLLFVVMGAFLGRQEAARGRA